MITMDSINKQQPEDNHEDLSSAAAKEKIAALVKKAQTCFFTTATVNGDSFGTRPMNVLQTTEDGTLWFLSAIDSHKNREIAENPWVKLYFQGSVHSDFLFLKGRAYISRDQQKIAELWNPLLKTWFTEGETDPRITVIQVVPEKGYYWDNKHGNAIAGVKMMIGAVIGKTLDDSIEGRVQP